MQDILFTVDSLVMLNKTTFSLKLVSSEKLPTIKAGQFIHIKLNDSSLILRRPFCVYKSDDYSVTVIVAIVGKGTKVLASAKKGDKLMAVAPIGNGWTLESTHKKVALIGGGVGVAPLLKMVSQHKDVEFKAFLGYSTKDNMILVDDFSRECTTFVSTDDGSYGYKGYVGELFTAEHRNNYKPDIILTCGSENMMRSIANISAVLKIPAYMSGENRMACGVGACLVCACAVRQADGSIANKRACVDGPVFKLEDIIL